MARRYEEESEEESTEEEEEEEGVEIPEWTPKLFGWLYRIYVDDDGNVEVSNLPDWLTLEFDGEETWTITGDLEEVVDFSWEYTDLDELFEDLNEYLAPLGELFKK